MPPIAERGPVEQMQLREVQTRAIDPLRRLPVGRITEQQTGGRRVRGRKERARLSETQPGAMGRQSRIGGHPQAQLQLLEALGMADEFGQLVGRAAGARVCHQHLSNA